MTSEVGILLNHHRQNSKQNSLLFPSCEGILVGKLSNSTSQKPVSICCAKSWMLLLGVLGTSTLQWTIKSLKRNKQLLDSLSEQSAGGTAKQKEWKSAPVTKANKFMLVIRKWKQWVRFITVLRWLLPSCNWWCFESLEDTTQIFIPPIWDNLIIDSNSNQVDLSVSWRSHQFTERWNDFQLTSRVSSSWHHQWTICRISFWQTQV